MTKTNAPTSLGELSRLLAPRRLHLEAADLRSVSPYHQCLHRRWRSLLFAAFLAANGMPTVVSNSRHEQVEGSSRPSLSARCPRPPRATGLSSASSTGSMKGRDHRITDGEDVPAEDPGAAGACTAR